MDEKIVGILLKEDCLILSEKKRKMRFESFSFKNNEKEEKLLNVLLVVLEKSMYR